eukprot:TRINITY_DN26001_c0_g1_i2.p1 TRINITY_DN26001_c0_g1~~TRINITY_DN26001_c0_g1_i2.p1  ORF type:complete len:141 (+),score=27.10 TRINITY_DN26001_c0_g1_i2:77-499(+)
MCIRDRFCILAIQNDRFYKVALLVFIGTCSVLMGISVVYSAVRECRSFLSFKVTLSLAIAFGLWFALLVVLMKKKEISSADRFPLMLVLALSFMLLVGYSICYFIISDSEDLLIESTEQLNSDHKFGLNVQDLSENEAEI